MNINNLKMNQLSPDTFRWYQRYLKSIDEKDMAAYAAFLAEDCVLQSNNDPPVTGKAAILQGISLYWTTFSSETHDLANIYGTDMAFAVEALNHYIRSDGRAVTIRAVGITDRNPEGLVKSMRLYTDTTPVFKSAPD